MGKTSIAAAVCLLALLTAACGRYGEPRPPEYFSPRGVQDLKARADLEGVHFEWRAPDQDRRGRELESMNGYYVYRKSITKPSDIVDPSIEYDELAEIPDTHVAARDELRKQARAEGKISRRVKVDPEMLEFSYTDTSAASGQTYLYRIVPFNQGDVEGLVPKVVKVLYRGDASVVSLVDAADIDEQTAELSEGEAAETAESPFNF